MKPDFKKSPDGLLPAIIQDSQTNKVLMLGYMNKESFKKTKKSGNVTFYSRSKKRLWEKGEISGNSLIVKEIFIDCDADTILIKAKPKGKVCHEGHDTCFVEKNIPDDFLFELEQIIYSRKKNPKKSSHTSALFARGVNKISQKVGEEAVEFIIEAIDNNDELLKAEASDLLYHFLVLLAAKDIPLSDVIDVLRKRRR
ncbi:MAG: bifunctional phosphoribosyl-AMP cyclohydrolase/phosphoribosyl-ATP diphosphatase HisIE [Pyrinomonadaceae bacterium]|nr:bifunctional phosphoribosyl-AMP cyclohydrolase/phosphoribosyl-ATP diphosphatase HisIE [Pyrinomonadaceae bacterium]